MRINNNQNNPSFKTRFEFINPERFRQLLLDNPEAVEVSNSLFGDYKEIWDGGCIFTEGIGSCTAYGLTLKGTKEAFLGHYNRSARELTDFIDIERIEKEEDPNKKNRLKQFIEDFISKARGFIIGGDRDGGMHEFFERDVKKFRKAKIPTTIFWGQRIRSSDVLVDADKDICYICKNMEAPYEDAIMPFYKFAETPEQIKEAYHIIHVEKGDEVWVNGQRIDSELLNQNDEKYC